MEKGEVYKLGEHRLMCGDSTDPIAVEQLMQWQSPELVITDPPYNFATRGAGHGDMIERMHRMSKELEPMADFNPEKFLSTLSLLFPKNHMNAYIFSNRKLLPDYLNYAVRNKYAYNLLVWNKKCAIPIISSHKPDIEYIIHLRKNAVWNEYLKGVNYSKCLDYSRERKSEENGYHPTVKPLGLIATEIQISSNEGGIVVDLFGGSGTTLMACEQTGRRCFMMEISPKYCDVIVRRWEKSTGRSATREGECLDSFKLIP